MSTSPALPSRPFRLVRYFSWASLAGVVLVTVALLWGFKSLNERHLIAQQTRSNNELAHILVNTIWRRHRAFITEVAPRTPDQLRADTRLAALDGDVRQAMRGLAVVKVKLYNLAGQTVYSTEADQIGEDKSANEGLQRALGGEAASQLMFRKSIDAFEGTLIDRDLISSYVPVRVVGNAEIEGAMEIYSDVTDLLKIIDQARWQIAVVVLGMLGLLYLFLLIIVRRADGVIALYQAEQREREMTARHQAMHDTLTGVANRGAFNEQFQATLDRARTEGGTFGLLFIDLDDFKQVNDRLGHHAGDELLKIVAARIQGNLRKKDKLFRAGGDEFIALLPSIAQPSEAGTIAERIIASIQQPVILGDDTAMVGASIGIAAFPWDGNTASTLIQHADAAMYRAKQSGRGRYAFHTAEAGDR